MICPTVVFRSFGAITEFPVRICEERLRDLRLQLCDVSLQRAELIHGLQKIQFGFAFVELPRGNEEPYQVFAVRRDSRARGNRFSRHAFGQFDVTKLAQGEIGIGRRQVGIAT